MADYPPGNHVRQRPGGSLGEDRPKNKNHAMHLAKHGMVFSPNGCKPFNAKAGTGLDGSPVAILTQFAITTWFSQRSYRQGFCLTGKNFR
jgi:hypothetical protein